MDSFMTSFSDAVAAVDSFVWGWAMIALLLGTHLVMTFRTKFIQRKIGKAVKLSLMPADDNDAGDVSPFGALSASLAATIGTGNIVGVATGLFFGGPGAIFWMWITGVFGMATSYAETFISVKYRVKDQNGEMLGGAMYALERGFKIKQLGKILAILFALFAFIASFGIGGSVQSNALTSVVMGYMPTMDDQAALGVKMMMGVILMVLVGVVILGGIKSVTRVTERLVPIMAILYTLGCLIIIGMNFQYVGEAIALIVSSAFTGKAAFGGAVGGGLALALQFGFKRGLFSNESGLGSGPIVAAHAATKNPARQALVAMTGPFWDTVIICAVTGIMLVSTMLANPAIQEGILAGEIAAPALLSTTAFASIPVLGPIVLAFGMILFSYSTMLGWSMYGNRAVMYLFGQKGIRPYQIAFLIFVFWGCIGGGDLVWNISDITNALMAVPNCIAVLVLGGVIAKGTQYYVYEDNLDEVDTTEIPVVTHN